MRTIFLWSIAIVGLSVLSVIYFWPLQDQRQPEPQSVATAKPAAEAAVRYPVDVAESGPPLPLLADSDEALTTELGQLFGRGLPQFIYLKDIIHRVVATIDNLPRDHVAAQLMPVKTIQGIPATEKSGGSIVLSASNASRYQAYVSVVEMVPTDAVVAVYARFYPLFQEEYESLGYPGKHFNDRVVEVIDHLLATPDEPEPLRIVQPRVLYEFADPRLENLSAGQKIMLRVGKTNREKLKSKLQELRQALTHLGNVQ